MSDMDKVFKAKKTGMSANEASRSDKSRSEGDVSVQKYRNYYDVSNTITTAQATNPNDEDNANYNQEQIFAVLERNAERITVSNDGSGTLFVIASHQGGQSFSRERPIYPGENKTYFNIYELRLRSPTAGLAYRVTEYPICCTGNGTTGISAGFAPIEKGVIQNTALPVANTNFFATALSPTNTPTTFRVMAAISVAGNLNVTITNGGNTQTLTLNVIPGPALVANGVYTFDILVHSGDTINYQYSVTGGTILIFRVQEIDAATA